MIQQEGTSIALIRKGIVHGEVSDGDSFDRPEGSLLECKNLDYDVETGELITRNPSVDSHLLDGFTMPENYSIMPDGFKLFSFNQPIDKEVALLFITNGTDVKIYTNWWYNPPALNTDPVGSNNDYENCIVAPATGTSIYEPDHWYNEWIELTGYKKLNGFARSPGTLKFTVTDTDLNQNDNYYRGWFVWNFTKASSGSSDQIQNESFACIEAYDKTAKEFTIQNRTSLNLTNLGWNSGDEVYLLRYPIIVHKRSDLTTADLLMKFSSVKMIKTATSVNCLIGQDGGLNFGFLFKDNIKKDNHSSANFTPNVHKYYGWWLDYETYPDDLTQSPIDVSSAGTTLYTKAMLGMNCTITNGSKTGYNSRHALITATLDFTSHVALMRMYQTVALGAGKILVLSARLYHQYSRRIVGIESFLSDDDKTDADPTQIKSYYNEKILSGTTYIYTPVYSQFVALSLTDYFATLVTGNVSAQAILQYNLDEKIYTKSTFGVYAQGRMFVNDLDKPDNVKYSLFQKEDIFPLQNTRPVDAVDRDRNYAMELLGINPVILKGNSLHIANIEGATEVGWRMLETKAQTGTRIPRSVVRTPSGVAFCNEQGVYLLQGEREPLNLLLKRKRQAYLALANKDSIFGTWYGKHNELWYYIGNGEYWICKLSPEEKQIGWKTYHTNFVPTGFEVSDSGDLYFAGTNFIHRYTNDSEVANGKDADNTAIVWEFTENFNLLNSRRDKFHHTESLISIDYELRTSPPIIPNGNNEVITIQIYNQADELIQTKVANINVLGSKILQISLQNDINNAMHAIRFKVSGTMNYLKRFKITEIYSRVRPLPQTIRTGYNEVRV